MWTGGNTVKKSYSTTVSEFIATRAKEHMTAEPSQLIVMYKEYPESFVLPTFPLNHIRGF